MKSGLIRAVIVTAAVLGPMIALADDQGTDAQNLHQGTKVFVRDSVITTKVKARLAAEHITSLARIHVDTDADGVVYLSGTAQSQEAIDTAIKLARDTEHVRDVHADIAVRQSD